MRLIAIIIGAAFISLSLLVRPIQAQSASGSSWQQIRERQPTQLQLKMTLAKDHYFQGEEIDAALAFSNGPNGKPSSLAVGAGVPGAVFRGSDQKGNTVPDPLQWRNDWFPVSSAGIVGIHKLGQYSLTLPVNDSLRFDHPGVYKIYAQAYVTEETTGSSPDRAELVSNETTVTIVPLTSDQEKAVIDEATQKIAASTSPDQVRESLAQLCYLQTSLARDQLVLLLGRHDYAGWVQNGFLGASDPAAEADHILKAVQAGQIVLDENGAELYGELKTANSIRGSSPAGLPEKEVDARYQELQQARKAARQEIIAAAVASTTPEGQAHIEALWTAFKESAVRKNPGEKDPDGGAARTAMAAHQLELPSNHVKDLMTYWNYWGSADFLPLVRREANLPSNNLCALIALCELQPDEARPKIIAEFQQPEPRFFEGHYPASTLLPKIPPMPLPQFDSLFRDKLAKGGKYPFPTIPVIACFGSPALLPDMINAHRLYGADIVQGASYSEPWDVAIKESFFRYWLRCDPQGGAIGLEEEMKTDMKHDNGFSLTFLMEPWTDSLLPVAEWEITTLNPRQISEGISVLIQHGDDTAINPLLSALESLRGSAEYAKASSYFAGRMLKSDRLHLTDQQRQHLEALTVAAP